MTNRLPNLEFLTRRMCLPLAVVMLLTSSVISQDRGDQKRILFIFNNDSFTATQQRIDRALRSTLKEGSADTVETYSEFVGDTRSGTDYEDEFIALMKRKYDGKKFDLIFAVTNSPIQILRRNRDVIFPGTPVVYLTLNQRDIVSMDIGSNATAFWGQVAFKKNLELALSFHPNTKRVVVIGGVSETDNYWRSKAQEDFRDYESKLEFSYLTGLTVPEMRAALGALPPDTVVFFVTNVRDRAGNTYESPEYLRQVATSSTAPIYGTTDGQLGNGIVGGWLVSFDSLGAEAGRVGLRILAGEKPESIPPHGVESVPIFDWRQLKRWGISESSLPPGSILEFKQLTLWEEYKWYILGASLALTLETLLIAWLVFLRIRRRQAVAEAELLNSRVTEIVANVPGIVWEARTDEQTKKRKTTFISDYLHRILGYSPDEWLEKPQGFGLQLVVDEDRERVARESEAVIETGKDGVSEYRWRTKDGGIRWVENHLSPIIDGDAGVVGLRGVALDVTNRKLAEEKARQTEEKERAILSAIPDLMFVQTPDGVYLDYHAKDVNELLVPPESFVGKNMSDVLPPELAQQFAEAFARTEQTETPQIIEYKLNLGGTDRWFEGRVVRSGENILSVVRDITDRKNALEELQQSEQRFSKSFRANPQPMSLSLLADGRFLDVNESFLAMSGYTREEVIGRTSMELGTWETPERRAELLEALRREGSLVNIETRFRTKDGQLRFLLSSAEQLEIDGQACLLVASSDITDRKQVEEALVKAHDELVVAHEEVNRLKNQLEAENIYLQEELRADQAFGDIVGESDGIKYVLYKISQVAPTDSTVLITGETGTGKELVARAIHDASSRSDRPLIKVNCAALSPTLVESELFGHEKGAFTGAGERKLGRFELANNATLLLDEIGELPLDLQSKLLRVLQDGEFERVGSGRTIKSDVRLIAATNRDLRHEVDKGTFREDLWYRLNVFPITVPPLRDRRDDIPILAEHFIKRIALRFGKTVDAISPESLSKLRGYSWPGNVRELANVIERAVINSRTSVLRIHEDFSVQEADFLADSAKTLVDHERDYIVQVLEEVSWRIEGPNGAARVLGINPSTLRSRLLKLGLKKSNGKSST